MGNLMTLKYATMTYVLLTCVILVVDHVADGSVVRGIKKKLIYLAKDYPQFMYAGRDKDDMWNQMQEHIPYLEQIYFAGGEPLIMEEHYNVLKELVRLKRFDVRLQYNTNFSRLNLKDENVLDYWKLFNNVSIGASLDAMGPRAEYIRKGTKLG
jgi:hypothetical protein